MQHTGFNPTIAVIAETGVATTVLAGDARQQSFVAIRRQFRLAIVVALDVTVTVVDTNQVEIIIILIGYATAIRKHHCF
ncbi:hypothetical protein EBB59_12015 [Lysobacter pythonis]|uniref:Uncharacterized protein n=1 Tax=Solilutibacter pythonis TaxID=2483112 RepID=A0A3M2HJS2_9GAMM|nr:hypothetical protein EBB59_12015 [Lysobacter pythonis]